MKKLSAGFTMIELLIVIGVLGILATGLLAAVDPFEQLKKARDTNNRQAAVSLQTAFIRYYATHGQLPWDLATLPDVDCAPGLFGASRAVGSFVSAAGMKDCVTLLENDGELKSGFVAALGTVVADSMNVNSPTVGSATICFPVSSKAIFADSNTKFTKSGADRTLETPAACTDTSKAAASGQKVSDSPPSCYVCAK